MITAVFVVFAVIIVHADALTLPTPSTASDSTRTRPTAEAPTFPGPGSEPATVLPDGYAYLTTASGAPLLVNGCQPVAYQFDPSQIPAGGAAIVDEAIATVVMLTGLRATTGTPATENTRITIAYKHEHEDYELAGSAIGVAHVQSVSTLAKHYIVSVDISLEIDWFNETITTNPDLATMVVVHEILHGNGLAHVNDPDSIMY